jgi:hypothetical protein
MAFSWLEAGLDRIFTPACNPLYHLGALGFLYYWVVAATGIYLFIFFDTGITEAYGSIDSITLQAMVSRRGDAQPAPLRVRWHGRHDDGAHAARVLP